MNNSTTARAGVLPIVVLILALVAVFGGFDIPQFWMMAAKIYLYFLAGAAVLCIAIVLIIAIAKA